MDFKDVNCGFYSLPRKDLLVSSFGETRQKAQENRIVERAVYHYEMRGISVKQANQITMECCAGCADTVPVLRMLPPAYGEESYGMREFEDVTARGAWWRAWPKRDAVFFCDWIYGDVFKILEQTRTPLLVALEEVDLRDAAQVKRQYPQLRLILTNTTQWMNRQYLQFLRAFPHVYLDTCNLLEYQGIENVTGLVGADRILFGTNMPNKEPYDNLFQFMHCGLADEQKEMIACRNFERLRSEQERER